MNSYVKLGGKKKTVLFLLIGSVLLISFLGAPMTSASTSITTSSVETKKDPTIPLHEEEKQGTNPQKGTVDTLNEVNKKNKANISPSDWSPEDGHKMHHPQLPNLDGGKDVYAANYTTPYGYIADDWNCTETGPITDIHFWGAWKVDKNYTINSFDIKIAKNTPSNILWSRTFQNDEFIVDEPSYGPSSWVNPFDPSEQDDTESDCYQYNIENITDPYVQTESQTYWLIIGANVTKTGQFPENSWGWRTSNTTFGDLAHYHQYNWSDQRWEPLKSHMAFVINGKEQKPCISLNKQVAGPQDPCNTGTVRFNITIHNCGDSSLTDVTVIDSLDPGLEYTSGSGMLWHKDGSEIWEEPVISGNSLYWFFEDNITLAPNEYLQGYISTSVNGTGTLCNQATVTAETSHGTTHVNASDSACITCKPKEPCVDLTKRVRDPESGEWEATAFTNVNSTVRFNLTICNCRAQLCDLSNITVTDKLPYGLEYEDSCSYRPSSIGVTPTITGSVITWDFLNTTLAPDECFSIAFTARINVTGSLSNHAIVNADSPCGSTHDLSSAKICAEEWCPSGDSIHLSANSTNTVLCNTSTDASHAEPSHQGVWGNSEASVLEQYGAQWLWDNTSGVPNPKGESVVFCQNISVPCPVLKAKIRYGADDAIEIKLDGETIVSYAGATFGWLNLYEAPVNSLTQGHHTLRVNVTDLHRHYAGAIWSLKICCARKGKDTDGDGMPDVWEVKHKLDPLDAGDAYSDPDEDGLANCNEYAHGTSPHNSDTDDDGVSDGEEVESGTDPTEAGSTPVAGMNPIVFYGMVGGVSAVVAIGVAVYVLKVRKP